jgi:hypothetical protein
MDSFAVVLLVVGLVVYFIPSFIAFDKDKRNKGAIFALNLLLDWTVIGWVGALVWSLKVDAPAVSRLTPPLGGSDPR